MRIYRPQGKRKRWRGHHLLFMGR